MRKTPRYQSLANALRHQVEAGVYSQGDKLPSEPMLSRDHGVSRGTVVKAIELLVAEGLAFRKQGIGTFVARTTLRREPGKMLSFTETAMSQGYTPTQKILSFQSAETTHMNSIGCFEPAMQLNRLRYLDNLPTALHRSVIPNAILDRLSADVLKKLHCDDATNFSLYAALEETDIELTSASEFVSARLASNEEQEQMGLGPHSVVIVITRQSFNMDGRLIEVTEASYPSDAYTYETTLKRNSRIMTH